MTNYFKWDVLVAVFILVLCTFVSASANNPTNNVSKNRDNIDWEKIEDEISIRHDGHHYHGNGYYSHHHHGNHRLATKFDLDSGFAGDTGTIVSKILEILKDNQQDQIVTNDPSIKQTAKVVGLEDKLPDVDDLPTILRKVHPVLSDIPAKDGIRNTLRSQVTHGITRTLQFYEAHLDQITEEDDALGLLFLKGIDDKHGKLFQKTFPLEQWIQLTCSRAFKVEGDFCSLLTRQWKNRSGPKFNPNYWKPASLIQQILDKTEDDVLRNIGNEPEALWGKLDAQCQSAIVERCEIPYVCERTLLDPSPQSQYFLAHQLLQRLFTEIVDCPSVKYVTEEKTYLKLCAKMDMEAKYLDILQVPPVFRDLFAEYVGFCGYMGYSNFLREDWLAEILSWQSKSDYGCFTNKSLLPFGIVSTDNSIKRNATQKEMEQGIMKANERCLTHLTSVSLMSLSVYWDYLMDSQTN